MTDPPSRVIRVRRERLARRHTDGLMPPASFPARRRDLAEIDAGARDDAALRSRSSAT